MEYTLSEALRVLESGDYVSLRFITADFKRGASGKVIELQKCRIQRKKASVENTAKSNIHEKNSGRNPNHNYHFTRNVELPNKQIRKVHPILITHINNIPVL